MDYDMINYDRLKLLFTLKISVGTFTVYLHCSGSDLLQEPHRQCFKQYIVSMMPEGFPSDQKSYDNIFTIIKKSP